MHKSSHLHEHGESSSIGEEDGMGAVGRGMTDKLNVKLASFGVPALEKQV